MLSFYTAPATVTRRLHFTDWPITGICQIEQQYVAHYIDFQSLDPVLDTMPYTIQPLD